LQVNLITVLYECAACIEVHTHTHTPEIGDGATHTEASCQCCPVTFINKLISQLN